MGFKMNLENNGNTVIPKLSFTPDEAATATGFSKTRIFGAIHDQELTARKDGKATVIETTELLRWLRSRPTRGRQPSNEGLTITA
jgi:hypothetical protein